ncbi:MAG: hypothetical protein IPJ12_07365 [Betaproteobacteria bacterium]|nr:hypothetical protein [Betaproteobacteria bacterium]
MKTTSSKERSARKIAQTWYLVTNHLNLLYMLAAGLVMEPSGFRGKHYVDSLGAIPGWIPLFRNAIPAKALEQAVSERKHLRPCIVSFDLSGVSGPVQVLSREGKIRNADFPKVRLGKDDDAILIRAPLPLTLFSRICFLTDEDKKVFEIAAKDVSNVDLRPYCIEIENSLLCNTTDVAWPPIQSGNPRRRNTRQKESNSQLGDLFGGGEDAPQVSAAQINRHVSAQALGGLLAMLYHGASRSELGVKVFQLLTDSVHNPDGTFIQDPILAELPNWLNGGGLSDHSPIPARLYWGAVNALVAAQEENQSSQPVAVVLEYLDAQLTQLTDEKYRSRLERLIADMRGFLGLGGGTITELFERNKGSLSRPLLLFCLREHCVDLLEFSHPLLSDAEFLLAGILFGLRDGWLRLPYEMRNQALSDYVMYRISCVAHQKQGDVLSLAETPSPQPLRALFPSDADAWHKSQTNAAIEIAKSSKWRDCIEMIVASADGSPLDEPKQESGKFIFHGETTSTIEIRHQAFLKRLGEWPPIDTELELKIRGYLNPKIKGEINLV